MTRQQISRDVKVFISAYISSVFRLEVLLLLHRNADRWWIADRVSQDLGIDVEAAHTELEALAEMKFLSRRLQSPTEYLYDPKDERLRLLIDGLAVAYSMQRVAVFSLILTKADNRMRRFAEAFRLIKGDD